MRITKIRSGYNETVGYVYYLFIKIIFKFFLRLDSAAPRTILLR